ncbi:MAG: tRNA preQ1(34) S-adenosylmethionine ribosyltransferase-isomerase QueA [Gammaproteobacteria bacterium]
MQRTDFHYELPPELIAQTPPEDRAGGRLLVLHEDGQRQDAMIRDLCASLRPGDLMVFNDSRVIPARLLGKKATGGQVEVLVERCLDVDQARAFVGASKTPKVGATLHFADDVTATVTARDGGLFRLRFSTELLPFLERHGDIPLPPYIQRGTTQDDSERYQTVYANPPGSAAAPTACLHFDQALLDAIDATGVERATVTLHVGAGTFEPMRADRLDEHKMHSEYAVLCEETCTRIRATKEAGGRVIAVGTTSLRTLETAARSGQIEPFAGDTDIFIYPGWTFRGADALLTNFHLPESTLLMLVCAFAGYDKAMAAYRHAVEQRYRFFSYGDAMLLLRETS